MQGRAIGILAFVLLVAIGAGVRASKDAKARKLHAFTASELPAEERYKCLLPQNSKKRVKTDRIPNGGGTITSTEYEVGLRDRAYTVSSIVFPELIANLPPEQVYDSIIDSVSKNPERLRNVKAQKPRVWNIGAYEGRELDIEGEMVGTGSKVWSRVRFVLVDSRMFCLEATVSSQTLFDTDADVREFLNSLKLPAKS